MTCFHEGETGNHIFQCCYISVEAVASTPFPTDINNISRSKRLIMFSFHAFGWKAVRWEWQDIRKYLWDGDLWLQAQTIKPPASKPAAGAPTELGQLANQGARAVAFFSEDIWLEIHTPEIKPTVCSSFPFLGISTLMTALRITFKVALPRVCCLFWMQPLKQ